MHVSEFDFQLPEERIALRPLAQREDARLLVVENDRLEDLAIRDLPGLLGPNDLLVLNNTRVIPAALKAWRPAREQGGSSDRVWIQMNLARQLSPSNWEAFARPAKRLKAGDQLNFEGTDLTALVQICKSDGLVELVFNKSGSELENAITKIGQAPLPPYILSQRNIEKADVENYQTVYAAKPGAVAAPTAGLHITENLLRQLKQIVQVEEVTLHVGAGTFLPVKVDDTQDHVMHSEWGHINADVAQRITAHKQAGGNVVAVGTTALRILEAAAAGANQLPAFEGETNIFIEPGYSFKIVDALLTNFHLPRSTLFMLVAAFSGLETMKRAYAHAIAEHYRFYSYGDACFLDRRTLS